MDSLEMRALSRRRVLAGGLAVWLNPLVNFSHEAVAETPKFRVLTLKSAEARLRGPNQPPTRILGFDGAPTAPILRVKRGEEIKVRVVNALDKSATIHWHGVRLDNVMDGTPGLTQDPIAPGASFDYHFKAPDAGTFFYRAYDREQMEYGLSGLLIVEETAPVDVDQDLALLVTEWPNGDTSFFTANGKPTFDIPVRQNERLRLRLVNAGPRAMILRVADHVGTLMAIDGQPAEPFQLEQSRTMLASGARCDFFIDALLTAGASAHITAETGGSGMPIARFVYGSEMARRSPHPAPHPLPRNSLPATMDFRSAHRADVVVSSDSTSTEAPLFSVKRGRTVIVSARNDVDQPRTLHLHGHSFRLLDTMDDGWKPWWLDTLFILPKQTVRLAFVADNPGKWAIDFDGSERQMKSKWFEVT